MRGHHHPRCDLLLRSLCFDQNVLHLSLPYGVVSDFLDLIVRIPRVGEIHTHQFDALVVDHDCGGDGPFVDVFIVYNSFS